MIPVDPLDFTPEALRKVAPRCADCADGGCVDLAQGQTIYPQRPDLWAHEDGSLRWWWLCRCGAYVGTHKGTINPLGTPAGKATRDARMAAHAAFDPMWQKRLRLSPELSKAKARGRGYKWLAAQMGMSTKDCHIGMMTAKQALRVVDVCSAAKNARQA